MNTAKIANGIRLVLEGLDCNNKQVLDETPARVAKFFKQWTGPTFVLNSFESNGYNQLISVTQIPFYSLCEHHFLPFSGHAHIGYLPNKRIVGLSKLARIVQHYSQRLQVQERITEQVADEIQESLKPRGCIVILQAEHLCMSMRGAQVPGHLTTTSALRGCFTEDTSLKQEFLALCKL